MLTYPYTFFKDKTARPYIPISLQFKQTEKNILLPLTALLDTGADSCICSQNIGEILGIGFESKQRHKLFTANNMPLICFQENLIIKIANKSYEVSFYFSWYS